MATVSSASWTTASISGVGTTSGSTALSGLSGLAVNALAGVYVSGTNIPAGAYIVSNTATTATLSANATGTGTITLTLDYSIDEARVANLALARLAVDPILDTAEDTPAARQVRAIFGTTRDELLRNPEFNFAQKYRSLSEDTAVTALGEWAHAYTIPTSVSILKILEVDGNPSNLYEVIGAGAERRLYCNLVSVAGSPNTLQIKYVERVANPNLWDSLFKDALVLRLASKMAVPLAKRPDLMQVLQSEFAAIFNLAASVSSQERQVDEALEGWTQAGRGTSRSVR